MKHVDNWVSLWICRHIVPIFSNVGTSSRTASTPRSTRESGRNRRAFHISDSVIHTYLWTTVLALWVVGRTISTPPQKRPNDPVKED